MERREPPAHLSSRHPKPREPPPRQQGLPPTGARGQIRPPSSGLVNPRPPRHLQPHCPHAGPQEYPESMRLLPDGTTRFAGIERKPMKFWLRIHCLPRREISSWSIPVEARLTLRNHCRGAGPDACHTHLPLSRSMPSSISWLDYSERDRRRAIEVIRLFEEKSTVDELGVGSVRDAFADLLFPGLSTIQSRAKYFVLIPWVYQHLEQKRVTSREAAARARQLEIGLIDALAESSDSEGVIGIVARKTLKNLPSRIYWQGLQKWGVRRFPGSQDQYHRSLDAFYTTPARELVNDDGEPALGRRARNWHAGLPEPPAEFPRKASLRLTRIEGEYLRDRVLTQLPRTLLAYLVSKVEPAEDIVFPWEHPDLTAFPAHNRLELHHARCFSEVVHGSVLLYNLMLAEKRASDDLLERYRAALAEWAALLVARERELAAWDRAEFWYIVLKVNSGISAQTRLFIDGWLGLALKGSAGAMADNRTARQLVHARERLLKRGLARLDNRRSLENWGGASGVGQLDYRWNPVVRETVRDIQVAVREGAGDAAD
jgi:hypothetical protein